MLKLASVALLIPTVAFSANMTNNITGVGPKGKFKPYLCIQNESKEVSLILAPGKSGDANNASGNNYYAGGSLRFGGCTPKDTYLGYAGFNIDNTGNNYFNNYDPPKGVHIAYTNSAIDKNGNVTGKIDYTPILPNFNLTAAKENKNWQFAGINLSGLEFGKAIDPVVIPNLSQEDSQLEYSDLKEMEKFIASGMNTVRVPIGWSYAQLDGPGIGSINLSYYNNYVRPLLQTLTTAKVHTVLDLHDYMRYSKFGEQYSGCNVGSPCPDGTLITDVNAYKSVWGQLIELIQADKKIDKDYIMLDLNNEPVKVPDDQVFTIQAALINYLRNDKGFPGYILVEGNNWSGLHSWTTATWTGNGQTYSNATLFTKENFAKAGITDLSKILINVHQYLDSDFSGTQNTCQQDLSTQGPNGFNLQPFADYLVANNLKAIVTEFGSGTNKDSCSAPLRQFLQYLQDNNAKDKDYGFVGWTVWSAGHGWGSYPLHVKPESYQMDVLKEFLS